METIRVPCRFFESKLGHFRGPTPRRNGAKESRVLDNTRTPGLAARIADPAIVTDQ
jgi:hypothetical protein